MSLTTEQITNQTFPHTRRGYDPVAVDRFLERVAREATAGRPGSMADIGRRRDEILAQARLEAEQLVRDAEGEVVAAHDRHERTLLEVAEAEADLDRLRSERTDLVGEAEAEAEQLVAAARAEAEALRQEAVVEVEELRASRWDGVGERVTRILARAEDEAAGLLAEAVEEAERLTTTTAERARTTTEAADTYADDVRRQADERAASQATAARTDREQAAEVLAAARSEAERVIADAETTAAAHRADAEEQARRHVADVLTGARADLDRIRAAEARTATSLEELTTAARLALDERAASEPDDLHPVARLVPSPGDDAAEDPDEDAASAG